jgi:hypothetical protein
MSCQITDVLEDTADISGFITDVSMNPIEGAQLTFSCGEESFECFSNQTGYYHLENLPLLYCVWNITVYKTGYKLSYMDMPIVQNTQKDFTLIPINSVVLEIEIIAGWHLPAPRYEVKNIGDSTVHNVVLIDTLVEGNILYNNRDVIIADEIEPAEWMHFDSNTWFIGFGTFSIMIKISCDEGTFSSEEINGFIIGSLIFIP